MLKKMKSSEKLRSSVLSMLLEMQRKLGLTLGIRGISEALTTFGLGKKTGIALGA